MIRLIDVTKYYMTDFGRHYIFRDVTLDLPLDKSVGIIGPNGAGKSTFLRLIAGADIPSSGTILRSGKISPPMGLTPGLQASLNGTENARFAGRIYGMSRDEINDMTEYVRELADIGDYFDMPVSTYSAGMKQRVSFAINMSMQFDYYLFDEISAGGDREFRKTARALVQERLQTSKFLMTSHSTSELLELCQAGIVIQNGELTYFDDINDAAAFYGDDEPKEDRKRRNRRGSGDETGDDVRSAGEGDDAETRAERRERRRQLLEDRKKRVAAAPADVPALTDQTAVAETADAGQEPAPEDRRRLRREQRERDSAAVTDIAALPAPAAAEPAEPAVALEAEDEAIRAKLSEIEERRRLRREHRLAEAEALRLAEAAAAEEDARAEAAAQEEQLARQAAAEEKRRLRREERERKAAADAAAEAAAEEAAAAVAASDSERKARTAVNEERRRQRREEREREAEATRLAEAAAAEEDARAEAAAEAARLARRAAAEERRRLRREQNGQGADASEHDVSAPDLATGAGSADEAGQARLAAVSERRRQRLEARQTQMEPDGPVSADAPPMAAGDMPKSREEIRAQRLLARQDRTAPDETGETRAGDTPDPLAVPHSPDGARAELPAANLPPMVSPPMVSPPMVSPEAEPQPARPHLHGLLRLTQLVEDRKHLNGDPALPGVHVATGPASLLVGRALLRQERAQIKAARAARMLLQHLETQAGDDPGSVDARVMLISAAQETAAAEAAEARRFLEGALATGLGGTQGDAGTGLNTDMAAGQPASGHGNRDR